MVGDYMTQTRIVKKIMRRREIGVSLLELMITLGIGMVLMAMATPLVRSTINNIRLRGAGGNYANLLQQTRMHAVSDDRYYPVYATTTPGTVTAWQGVNAFADLNLQGGPTGLYTTNTPADIGTIFNQSAVLLRARGAAPAVANLELQFMPGIAPGVVNINPNDNWSTAGVSVVTFGSRGLPCALTVAPAPGLGGVCNYLIPPNFTPVAFEIFLQNRQNVWEAITVNPSGRVREWRYDISNATWQPLD
jgi:type II secretory pathway pseudopilin PulG